MSPLDATSKVSIVNAMTIDVEDYFHVSVFDGIVPRHQWDRFDSRVCANTDRLLQIFRDASVKATFFVLAWVAERQLDLMQRIAKEGHELASHGYSHRLIYDQTREAFRDDVRRAKRVIEDASGRAVVGYRAPSYSVTPRSLWALDVLLEEGYRYDSSIFPIRHDRYGIPLSARLPYEIERRAGRLVEVPASTTRLGPINLPVAGGGYFRILPYWWTRWGIARVNAMERRPTIFYLHPWEIDPDQPRLRTSWLGRFRHYRNLDKAETRLRALLRDFKFDTVANLVANLPVSVSGAAAFASLPYQW